MKENISMKIKPSPPIGIYSHMETKHFSDDNFSTRDNIFQYRLSKIHIFLGEKNKILGIQSFFKNLKNEEKSGQMGFDESLKVLNMIKFEIPSNDYLCCLNIFKSDNGIGKLKFSTKKGKELTVGEDGEDTILSYINGKKESIILSISGGYSKQLDFIRFMFININDYFGHTLGYFELRIKLKNDDYRNKINTNIDKYNETDQILIRACLLPAACFNEIIRFCMK